MLQIYWFDEIMKYHHWTSNRSKDRNFNLIAPDPQTTENERTELGFGWRSLLSGQGNWETCGLRRKGRPFL